MEQKYIWQRLYKVIGEDTVRVEYGKGEDDAWLHMSDAQMSNIGLVWLCPKPNRVILPEGREYPYL